MGGFASKVGHPRSDLVKLLMMNDSINIRGTGVVLQVLRDSANPVRKGLISWIDHVKLNYNIILVISM